MAPKQPLHFTLSLKLRLSLRDVVDIPSKLPSRIANCRALAHENAEVRDGIRPSGLIRTASPRSRHPVRSGGLAPS